MVTKQLSITEAWQNGHLTATSKAVNLKWWQKSHRHWDVGAPPQSKEEDVSNGMETFHIVYKKEVEGHCEGGETKATVFWDSQRIILFL